MLVGAGSMIFPQSGIMPLIFQQFQMISLFNQFAFIQHQDLITVLYRTQPVRNENNCFTLGFKPAKDFLYFLFTGWIQAAGCFI